MKPGGEDVKQIDMVQRDSFFYINLQRATSHVNQSLHLHSALIQWGFFDKDIGL